MSWIKQLFCSHKWDKLSENKETYTVGVRREVYGGGSGGTLTDFWGQPITTQRTTTTVLLACNKCGKTKTEVL